MDRFLRCLPALAAASLIATSLGAEPLRTEIGDITVPSLVAALETGQSTEVALVMDRVLDDPAAARRLAALEKDAAQRWFAVLFHPEFVNALVAQGDDLRHAEWDTLVTILEAAYFRDAPPLGTSG